MICTYREVRERSVVHEHDDVPFVEEDDKRSSRSRQWLLRTPSSRSSVLTS